MDWISSLSHHAPPKSAMRLERISAVLRERDDLGRKHSRLCWAASRCVFLPDGQRLDILMRKSIPRSRRHRKLLTRCTGRCEPASPCLVEFPLSAAYASWSRPRSAGPPRSRSQLTRKLFDGQSNCIYGASGQGIWFSPVQCCLGENRSLVGARVSRAGGLVRWCGTNRA